MHKVTLFWVLWVEAVFYSRKLKLFFFSFLKFVELFIKTVFAIIKAEHIFLGYLSAVIKFLV